MRLIGMEQNVGGLRVQVGEVQDQVSRMPTAWQLLISVGIIVGVSIGLVFVLILAAGQRAGKGLGYGRDARGRHPVVPAAAEHQQRRDCAVPPAPPTDVRHGAAGLSQAAERLKPDGRSSGAGWADLNKKEARPFVERAG